MFQELISLDNIKYVGTPPTIIRGAPLANGVLYHHKYIIEDSNFIEEWEGTCDQVIYNTLVRCGALISCYEKKRENVAFELAMYHKFMVKSYYWYKLDDEIKYNIEHTPVYKEYAPQVREILKRYDSLKAFW